jgi:hypothetical protein
MNEDLKNILKSRYIEFVDPRRTDNTMVKIGQKDKQRSTKHYTEN